MSELDNLLNSTKTKSAKAAKPAKTEAKPAKAAKPAKTEAKAAKPAKTEAKSAKAAKPAKTEAKSAKAAKPAKTEAKPKKKVDPNVSMTQPEDGIVLKAVRKLKEATLAAQFAHDLGVHRRVIRAQLQRLAKDKANGVKMVKDGAHWLVSNTAK